MFWISAFHLLLMQPINIHPNVQQSSASVVQTSMNMNAATTQWTAATVKSCSFTNDSELILQLNAEHEWFQLSNKLRLKQEMCDQRLEKFYSTFAQFMYDLGHKITLHIHYNFQADSCHSILESIQWFRDSKNGSVSNRDPCNSRKPTKIDVQYAAKQTNNKTTNKQINKQIKCTNNGLVICCWKWIAMHLLLITNETIANAMHLQCIAFQTTDNKSVVGTQKKIT